MSYDTAFEVVLYFIDCIFELITFPCINFICLVYYNHYHMNLIAETHFVLCLLLSNVKFYIHSDGSLEY